MELMLKKYQGQYRNNKPVHHDHEDKKYYLDMIRNFYSEYAHSDGNILDVRSINGLARRTVKELRDYARGVQPIEPYLINLGFDKKEIEKFRKNNISFDPPKVYAKYRNLILSKMEGLSMTPVIKAEDEYANTERAMERNIMRLTRQEETIQTVGNRINDPLPNDIGSDGIDHLFQLGEIKLPIEIFAKDAFDKVMIRSKWESIAKMLYEDLIDLGGIACDQYISNERLVVDYVDYARVIVRPSIYPDYRDSDVRGYIRQRKLSDILMIQPDIEQIEYLRQIDKSYTNFTLGAWLKSGYREDYIRNSATTSNMGDFGVTEVKLYWLDNETQLYVTGTRKNGERQFERVPLDFNISDRMIRAGKRLEKVVVQKMYQAVWVVGTDIIYDYGEVDYITRPGEVGADSIIWPMQIYDSQQLSITEKVIPYVDELTIAVFKRRDLISKIPPGPRMVLYTNRMKDSITLGNKTYTIQDIKKMYQREGIFMVEEEDDFTLPNEIPREKKPFDLISETGVAEDLMVIDKTFISALQGIRDETGMNEVTDGGNPNPDMLKVVAENMQLASNSALRPTLKCFMDFYRNLTSATVWRTQIIAASGQYLNSLPISDYTVGIIQSGVELLKYNLSIQVDVNDKSYFDMLMQDLMSKKDQFPVEAYFTIFNAINGGDLKKAEYYLIKYSEMVSKLNHKRQLEVADATAKANQRASQEIELIKRETARSQADVKTQLEIIKAELAEERAEKDHQRKMEEIRLDHQLTKESSIAVTAANNANRLDQ